MYRAATARRVRIRQAEQSSFSGRTARGDLHHHEGLPRREAQAWLERRDGVRRATICLDPDDLAAGSAARSALAEGGSTDRLVKSAWQGGKPFSKIEASDARGHESTAPAAFAPRLKPTHIKAKDTFDQRHWPRARSVWNFLITRRRRQLFAPRLWYELHK